MRGIARLLPLRGPGAWRAWTLGLACALLIGGVLGGCSSLPVFVPDLARRAAVAPQLEGARGPLSAARSREVLAKLKARSPDSGLLERHLAIEEAIVGSPLTVGNEVRLLQDGPATYRAMLAAIASARDHVHVETYIIEDDEVGRMFSEALIARRRAGVAVSLLHDGVGTLRTPRAFFQRLKDAGIEVLEFNPVNPLRARKGWELNRRDHRKLMIVDGKVAFLGGINISAVYSSSGGSGGSGSGSGGGPGGSRGRAAAGAGPATPASAARVAVSDAAASTRSDGEPAPEPTPDPRELLAWRDTDIELRGPVVAELQKLFLEAWAGQKGPPLTGREPFPRPQAVGQDVVRAIGSSPDEPYSLIYATLLSALHSAERSIRITNAYFAPDPQLLEALEAAAARGVEVTLILPSETDSWLVLHAGRAYYDRLLAAGIRIHERRGAILHSKTAVIDGVWSTVGSTNLDWRSFLHNHELNAVVLGTGFGAQVEAVFQRDLAASDEVTLASWRQRGLAPRAKEVFSRLWEYWL